MSAAVSAAVPAAVPVDVSAAVPAAVPLDLSVPRHSPRRFRRFPTLDGADTVEYAGDRFWDTLEATPLASDDFFEVFIFLYYIIFLYAIYIGCRLNVFYMQFLLL